MTEPVKDLDENHLIAERRAKLAQLREQGMAFPNDFRRAQLAGELHAAQGEATAEQLEAAAITVTVAGRMMAKRVMGKASFATIADPTGSIQLFLQAAALAESYEQFKGWDVGDTLGATGQLFRTRTGELSVRVTHLRLLVKSLRPLPDKWHGLADTDTRYRQRYVDLIMNADSRAVFVARTRIVRQLRVELDGRGFMEVETPMMQPIPGGVRQRGPSSPITTRWTCRCTCAWRRSCTSSDWWSADSSGCTRSTAISATKGCPRGTTPSSRCWSFTGHMPTTTT